MSKQDPKQNKPSPDEQVILFMKELGRRILALLRSFAAWFKKTIRNFNTDTWPKIKLWFMHSWQKIKDFALSIRERIDLYFKNRRKKKLEQKDRQALAADIRAKYDRGADETVSNLDLEEAIKEASLDAGVQHIKTEQAIDISTEKSGFRQKATEIRSTIQTAFATRRNKSTAYKPYQYKGIRSRLMRHGRQKVYRLKGYTTVARVNRKRRREYIKRQRNVLILTALLIIAIIVIFTWMDPIPKLQSILHDIGFVFTN